MTKESKIILAVAVAVVAAGIVLIRLPQRPQTADLPQPTKITIVEFADFQCPACAASVPILRGLLQAIPAEDLTFVFRHFPLPSHQHAVLAAQAAEAAGAQGKFSEMHDLLFARQGEWAQSESPTARFESYAQDLGLELAQFKADLADERLLEKITRDRTEGTKLGVNATPTYFLNGRKFVGVPGQEFAEFLAEQLR